MPTPTEISLARELVEPLVERVSYLLLRGGFSSFLQFRLNFLEECHRATTSFSRSTYGRINPEGLKEVLRSSGVLLLSTEYRSLLEAYSDMVGFLIADDLLTVLHPLFWIKSTAQMEAAVAQVSTLFPSEEAAAGAPVKTVVTVESAAAALEVLFASTPGADADTETAMDIARADVESSLTAANFPTGAVPKDDIVALVALLIQQHPCLAAIIHDRSGDAAPMTAAVVTVDAMATTKSSTMAKSVTCGPLAGSTFRVSYKGCSTHRKFERYEEDKDRRDEWIRGRDERDARPMYLRHTVGYAGHLPEYQYHFGRTFHVIEENLPQLTQPKPPLEPVPPEWYGPGRELRGNRMTAHSHRFA